jgi:hypothetical protein
MARVRINILPWFAGVLAALAVGPVALAESVSLTPVADTTLFQFIPTNNLGGTVNLLGGTTMNGARNRPLLRFDLSSIPAGATITNVTLTLTDLSGGTFPASNFQLHRLLVDWGEGTKTGNQGQSAETGEATWNSRFHNTTAWSAPGGGAGTDYATAVSGATLVSPALGTNVYQFQSTAALVADAQMWLNTPAANFGWILISDGEGAAQTSRRFASSENTAGLAPVLCVEFTAVPEPGKTALLIVSALGIVLHRARVHRRN